MAVRAILGIAALFSDQATLFAQSFAHLN